MTKQTDRTETELSLKKGGIVIGMKREGDCERIYYVGEDSHLLCIGATRSGKSRCLVIQSICTLGLSGESVCVSDPKAELYQYTSVFLKKLGYEVLCLDFKTPAKSMRYNLLQPIMYGMYRENFYIRGTDLCWHICVSCRSVSTCSAKVRRNKSSGGLQQICRQYSIHSNC